MLRKMIVDNSDWVALKSQIERRKKAATEEVKYVAEETISRPNLNETDIEIIKLMLQENQTNLKNLREKIEKSRVSIYHSLKKLSRLSIIDKNRSNVILQDNELVVRLKNLYDRKFDFHYLTGERVFILLSLVQWRRIEQIANETGISESSVYKYVDELEKLLEKSDSEYRIKQRNKELIDFLRSFDKKANEYSDIVYEYKSDDEFLIKSREKLNATLTAFSRFHEFGVECSQNSNRHRYYYLPKRKLGIEDIFVHSLKFSDDRGMLLNCINFLIKNWRRMDFSIVEKNSNKFNTLDLWFDILAYLNSREVINSEMFPEGSVHEKLIREAKPIFSNLEKYDSLSPDDIFLKMSLSSMPGSLLKCEEILNNSIPSWDYIYEGYMEEQKISEINCKLLINRLIALEKRTGKIIPIKNKLYRSLLKNSILNLLTDRSTVNELRDKLECPEYRIRNLLNKMVKEGIVEKFDTDPISFKIA